MVGFRGQDNGRLNIKRWIGHNGLFGIYILHLHDLALDEMSLGTTNGSFVLSICLFGSVVEMMRDWVIG
jgi:hypothetical protein